MPRPVYYVPVIEYSLESESFSADTREITRLLEGHEIPACYIRRAPSIAQDSLIMAAQMFLEKKILPVVELHPSDSEGPLRNLGEITCSGVLRARFIDGLPECDIDEFMAFFNLTGRHRIPIDFHFDPGHSGIEPEPFQLFLDRFEELADKYGHVQNIFLAGLNGKIENDNRIEKFNELCRAWPKATRSIHAKLWLENSTLRDGASDLGFILADPGNLRGELVAPGLINKIYETAGSLDVEIMPRLPLSRQFYARGFYTFEVGKVLDSWVDRSTYRYYKKRPEWLEDS